MYGCSGSIVLKWAALACVGLQVTLSTSEIMNRGIQNASTATIHLMPPHVLLPPPALRVIPPKETFESHCRDQTQWE